MIDISKGIQVGGFHFTVDLSEKAHRDLRADDDFGQCDFQNHSISVDWDNSPEQISKTFLHEVIEAVNHIYCDDKVEHEKLQELSYGLHQVCESLGVRFGKEGG